MIHIERQHGGFSYLVCGGPKDVRVYRQEYRQERNKSQPVPLFDMDYDPTRNRAIRTSSHTPLPQDTYTMIFGMAREHLAREVQARREKSERDFAQRQVAFSWQRSDRPPQNEMCPC